MDLFDIRKNYTQGHLDKDDLGDEPLVQIEKWVQEASSAQCLEHSAMVLSTVSESGAPSSRVVLLKKIDADGLYFFTNYDSRKGQQLAQSNKGAILLFWPELERQVNIEGVVEKCSSALSDTYFDERPEASRISAIASRQSQPVASRADMKAQWDKVKEASIENGIIRPDNWGGYVLRPTRVEFWQGGADRFHDRIVYRKEVGDWLVERLMP